jgi:transcription antitermination factor NusG
LTLPAGTWLHESLQAPRFLDLASGLKQTQGELVRILSGPFSGLVGKLEAVSEDHRILKISLRFFGRRHTAEVFLMDVEKVV